MFAAPMEIPDDFPPSCAPAQAAPLQVYASAVPDSLGHILTIPPSRVPRTRAETAEHLADCLPGPRRTPQEGAMPGPGISIEHLQGAEYFGSKGIEVDVPYQLQQVGFLFHQDGLVPILEEMAGPLVAPIKTPGVPC
jgi:hypothetical protein